METNPYEYDRPVSWTPQQNQIYAGGETNQSRQQYPPLRQAPAQRAAGMAQKPKPPKPMPKAHTLELAHRLKQGLLVAALVGFGTLSGLVAFHRVGTTATTSSTSQTNQTTTSSSSNGFLHQEGNNGGSDDSNNSNSTSSTSSASNSGSTSSSSSSTSSASQPVSGTRTS